MTRVDRRVAILMEAGAYAFVRCAVISIDAIQPLEKSASKPLICNDRFCGACGLQDFDAGRVQRRRARREWNGPKNGLPGQKAKSAGFRRNPREHAGPGNGKGQPRAVGLDDLVDGNGIEYESATVVWKHF